MGDSHSSKPGSRPHNDPSQVIPRRAADASRDPLRDAPVAPRRAAGASRDSLRDAPVAPRRAAGASRDSLRDAPVAPAAARDKTAPGSDSDAGRAGRIVHDARGNAVWDWIKDTTRVAIDSTSRLLKRLEVPDLQMEDTREVELRVESERDAG